MATAEEYRALARAAILQLVEQELAVVIPSEVFAKLSDRPVFQLPPRVKGIDPHYLQPAWNELVRTGRVERTDEVTRGGRRVSVLVPAEQHRRQRAVLDAAQRKRVLQARYLGWASGSPSVEGVIGPAGERIVHAALTRAATSGYRLVNASGTGQVSSLFGAPVPIGPLDNAAHLMTVDADGFPTGASTVLVEVKNIRHTLYPGDHEVHQLLAKAALLQQGHPERPFLPVLVARNVHYLTRTLANAIGFYTVSTKQQFIRGVDPEKLAEVVDVLGYDLVALEEPEPALVKHFTTTIQADVGRRVADWAARGSAMADLFVVLRRDDIDLATRDEYRRALLERAGVRDVASPRDDFDGPGQGSRPDVPF